MPAVKKLELSTNNRQSAFLILWSKAENGVLPPGVILEMANLFSVNKTTISRLWHAIKNKMDNAVNNQDGDEPGEDVENLLCDTHFFESGRKQTGRKKKWDSQTLKMEVRALRLRDRQKFSYAFVECWCSLYNIASPHEKGSLAASHINLETIVN
jgi:hypothetical protein